MLSGNYNGEISLNSLFIIGLELALFSAVYFWRHVICDAE